MLIFPAQKASGTARCSLQSSIMEFLRIVLECGAVPSARNVTDCDQGEVQFLRDIQEVPAASGRSRPHCSPTASISYWAAKLASETLEFATIALSRKILGYPD